MPEADLIFIRIVLRIELFIIILGFIITSVTDQYDDVRSLVTAPCWDCLGVELKKGFIFE